MATKTSKQERADAIEELRALLPPGSLVYGNVRHVSASGMSRIIDFHVPTDSGIRSIAYLIGRATGIGVTSAGRPYGLRVSGCGMDMIFHVVSTLSRVLYPDGFGCIGEHGPGGRMCPSNDHGNGDRDYSIHGQRTMLGCRRKVCTCHDEGAWAPGQTYPQGCLTCGCRWAEHWHKGADYALRSDAL